MTNKTTRPANSSPAARWSAGATALAAPAVHAQSQIRWRLQTYARLPRSAPRSTQPAIEAFKRHRGRRDAESILLFRPTSWLPTGDALPGDAARDSSDTSRSSSDVRISMMSPTEVTCLRRLLPLLRQYVLLDLDD